VRLVACVGLSLLGCGRIYFDPLRGDAGVVDGNLGDAPMVLGCAGLPATCGPSGVSDCCHTLPVPGGTFFRGYDVAGDGMYGMMNAPATVSSFWLDRYEVSVARFRRFVMAGQGTQATPPPANAGARTLNGMANQAGWQTAWNMYLPVDAAAQLAALNCDLQDQTWTNTPGANESLPMSCLSWFDAMAFCTWDGGWLPTEAEWNYAASGGNEHRAYPWSTPASSVMIDCSYANHYSLVAGDYCTNPGVGAANRVGSESPLGDARWGHSDMAGNLWEWTLDWTAPFVTPCDDCAQLTMTTAIVTRGGYFKNGIDNLRAANRSTQLPNDRVQHVGVRCARR
jgi:formylglycine-generating enzyme